MHMAAENAVEYYDATNIDLLPWRSTEEDDFIKRLFLPLIKNGVQNYISNIDTKVGVLKAGELVLPITINDGQYANSYVCSPYGQYISLALDSLFLFDKPILRIPAKTFLGVLGKYVRSTQINKVVVVNNWLVSTCLYPKIGKRQFAEITEFLKNRFPGHAILFRSIDAHINNENLQVLKSLGYIMIASRQIYMTDTSNKEVFETRIFKSDLRLLNKTDYEIIDSAQILPEDIPQILKYYNDLYLDKHSYSNPQCTPIFLKHIMENKLWTFKAIKKNGVIQGVFGYYTRCGMMSAPFFGYNTDNPEHTLIYRLLSTLLMLEAKDKRMVLHQSSGASFYKKIRRASPYMEYNAVFCGHLPLRRRIPWYLLQAIDNTAGVHFMKKY